MALPGVAFNPKKNKTYARSITASQVDAATPVGFVQGGTSCAVYNAGSVDVLFAAYAGAAPTLAFPADAAPPVGVAGHVIPAKTRVVIQIPANADSFSAIGQAAGPSLIYVQRGEGQS